MLPLATTQECREPQNQSLVDFDDRKVIESKTQDRDLFTDTPRIVIAFTMDDPQEDDAPGRRAGS